ncbi:hypothetical protein ACFX12_036629 [Malus domestica]
MGKEGKAAEPENMDARPLGVHNIKIQPFKLPSVGAHDVRVRIKAREFQCTTDNPKITIDDLRLSVYSSLSANFFTSSLLYKVTVAPSFHVRTPSHSARAFAGERAAAFCGQLLGTL